jgi:HEPN domain-containing protein
MKSDRSIALGWLRKARSDLTNAELCLSAGEALDTACFHCQQASEKSLKAYLIASGRPFPFVHDLNRLLNECVELDPSLEVLRPAATELSPYAVAMRYDEEFWPDAQVVETAVGAARSVYRLVEDRFPPENPRIA